MKKYKVGYTTGVFDMFHVGHLDVLRRAKEQCDYLIVGVNTDELVLHDNNDPPIIPFEDRMRIVDAIKYVDEVVPQSDENMADAWERLHFEAMFVGSDRQDMLQGKKYEQQFNPLGIDIVYLPYTDGKSSTLFKSAPPSPKCKIIGYTQGTFDLFHIGHLNLIQHAKKMCDYLIVGVNADELVKEYKHKTPIVCEEDRAELVRSIDGVNECFIASTLDKMDVYSKCHFDRIFIGDDWKGNPRWEQTRIDLNNYGVELVFLPHTNGISTTALSKKILPKLAK